MTRYTKTMAETLLEIRKKQEAVDAPEHEITVGNYTTKFFHMCGSAQKVMKKHADKDGAEELTRMQDVFYKMEKDIMMNDGGASDNQKKKAEILYDKIIAKSKEVGIAKEVDEYMKLHLSSITKGDPKLGFGRTDVKEAIDATDTGGEEEVSMAVRQVSAMQHFLQGIESRVKETGDMEEWFQNKLTKAHDYLKTLYAYGKGDVQEKLKVSDGLGAWISDFKKSDAPQFDNKTPEEKKKMAIAAYVSAGGKLD